ncbi:hypothetical protein I3760_07G038800 [Carya illinoinensis]|uniref:MADS-box domain-containing protein n=1 Tax=Carya illinoinensis TaxID=32201 RepID=A0A922EF67_CARIL|nr:hypothetical protein I3760_07G038800 [Carya illinoinensis]KAG6702544.1 hypothetical protein I3842_07G039800 [Carya illinoinensis]
MMNMGWKKTQKKMTQGANARLVSFSKRRSGLFKKASELCTLRVVETANIIFSPGGKAFSSGHPSAEDVINMLGHHGKPDAATLLEAQAHQERVLCDLKKQYSDLLKQLEAEKKRAEKLEQMGMECQGCSWFYAPIDELSLEELKLKSAAMAELKGKVLKELAERLAQGSAPSVAANSGGGSDFPASDPKAAP